MELNTIFPWYLVSIWDYTFQMLPCMGAALIFFLLARPARRRGLAKRGLLSGPSREGALLLFVVFSAGLASLTLFPADFWAYALDRLLRPGEWEAIWEGRSFASFYPGWETALSRDLAGLIRPFEEIRRTLRGGPWMLFILWGNIGMFIPIGFFPALLWRRPRWWRSALVGWGCSAAIEFVQLFIGRSTDIDDVILNTAGAVVGFWLFLALRAWAPDWTKQFQCHERGALPWSF